MRLERVSLAELLPPTNPVRATIDEAGLEELAQSIRRVGVVVPLAVKQVNGGYEVIHGHRRLLAAQRANVAAVPCVVWESGDVPDVVWKVHENLYREELSVVEEAVFYAELYEQLGQDVDKVCDTVRQNRTYVEGRLRLLAGDPVVLKALSERHISIGVAHELNKLKREADRNYLLEWAIREGATVSKVADWCRSYNQRADFEGETGPSEREASVQPIAEPEPPRCYLCGSSEDNHEFEFHYIHRSCRRALERQAAAGGDRPQATGDRKDGA